MKKELLTLFCVAGISFPALGGTYNIAPKARATASSSLNADGDASKVNDGYIRLDNAGEWVSAAQMPYWQQLPYPWIRLDWDEEVTPRASSSTTGRRAMRIRQAATSFSATAHVSE